MLQRSAFTFLVLVILASCASTHKSPAVSTAQFMIADGDAQLASLQEEFRRMYQDMGDLMESIALLHAHPGWPEMEQIIRSTTFEEEGGSDEPLNGDTGEALENWSAKWGESGEEFYSRFLNLVQQCTFLEVRRLSLRLKLRSVEIRLVHALALEATSKTRSGGGVIQAALDDLEALERQIDLYTINDLGLYEQGVARESS